MIATYLLIVLGGAVKAYGAGLACPDWPLCHGRVIPPLDGLVLLEYGHRLGATVVTALAVATTVAAFRSPGPRGPWVRGSLLALFLLAVQIVLGGLTVLYTLPPAIVSSHLGVASAFLSVWIVMAVSAGTATGERQTSARRPVWVATLVAALAVYTTMVVGSYMKSAGAGLACTDWPLCGGRLIPEGGWAVMLHFGHRVAALVAGVLVLYAAYQVVRHAANVLALVVPAGAAAGLVFIQVLLGGAAVRQALPPALTVTHLAVAAGLLATLVALTTAGYRLAPAGTVPLDLEERPTESERRRPGVVALDYIRLMKPRIVLLLLITGYAAMWLAARGAPPLRLTLLTLAGLSLTCGGANAVNMWWDRDIDAVMTRTRSRPLPAGRIPPTGALVFGLAAGMIGVLVLAFGVNLLAAALALSGYLFYVLVYTMWLKRSTAQNIVIGGAAGAVPPLVGWAAVTGTVGLAALLMFLVVFLWTPPHFWALALFRNDDYRRAGVPMLPVVRGENHTKWQILIYTLLVVPASLLLYWTGVVGPFYLWVAALLGAWLISASIALLRERLPAQRWAHRVFGYSILYLAFLFLAMVADVQP
ncbi:heme o synthase [Caldinitratiruptor microaerophilus]|uniref:heme o synthase n=1 Tax=Caldinitratiruptor microaerophilus TaxID=671077 RepID=UPI003873B1C2